MAKIVDVSKIFFHQDYYLCERLLWDIKHKYLVVCTVFTSATFSWQVIGLKWNTRKTSYLSADDFLFLRDNVCYFQLCTNKKKFTNNNSREREKKGTNWNKPNMVLSKTLMSSELVVLSSAVYCLKFITFCWEKLNETPV